MTPEDEAAAAAEAEARKAAEARAMRFTAPAGWGKSVADVTSALTNPPPESDDDNPENHRRDYLATGAASAGAGPGAGRGVGPTSPGSEFARESSRGDGSSASVSSASGGHIPEPRFPPPGRDVDGSDDPGAKERKKRGGRRVREAEERRAAKAAAAAAGNAGAWDPASASPGSGSALVESGFSGLRPRAVAPTPAPVGRSIASPVPARASETSGVAWGAGALGGVAWAGPIADIQRSASSDVLVVAGGAPAPAAAPTPVGSTARPDPLGSLPADLALAVEETRDGSTVGASSVSTRVDAPPFRPVSAPPLGDGGGFARGPAGGMDPAARGGMDPAAAFAYPGPFGAFAGQAHGPGIPGIPGIPGTGRASSWRSRTSPRFRLGAR